MEPSDRFSPSADVVAREVAGEMVLLHLGSGAYFGLNAVGGRIWQLLEEGNRSVASLCDVISDEFEAPRDDIEQDLLALAASLLEHGLVECAPA